MLFDDDANANVDANANANLGPSCPNLRHRVAWHRISRQFVLSGFGRHVSVCVCVCVLQSVRRRVRNLEKLKLSRGTN